MPQLQEHQLKVAAVAEMICENFHPSPSTTRSDVHRLGYGAGLTLPIKGREKEENKEEGDVIAACLLHDMGNIIKFDLNETQNLLNQNIDLAYWQKVKDEYLQKYGAEVHQASILIAKELDMSSRIIALIDCISFLGALQNAKAGDFGKKIVQYSDDRVAPQGVVSLEERFKDLRVRYVQHNVDSQERDDFEKALREIEKQIFEHCKIRPEDITEAASRPYIERLKNYKI